MTTHEMARHDTPVDTGQLELQTLEQLPCGCVVAIQRLRLSAVTVTSLEAKGPHCTFAGHRDDKVMRLGEPIDELGFLDDYLDDDVLPSLAA